MQSSSEIESEQKMLPLNSDAQGLCDNWNIRENPAWFLVIPKDETLRESGSPGLLKED